MQGATIKTASAKPDCVNDGRYANLLPTMKMYLILVMGVCLEHAAAHGQCNDAVKQQLIRMGALLILEGYSVTHELRCDQLRDDYSDTYNFYLRNDKKYTIIGACDNDCRDLDLCLYDENGNEIDCDGKVDDKPVVSASPLWSGSFTLKVKMYDCRANPCAFGIMVFGKDR